MPFVNGQYSAPSSSWNPAVPGTTIESAAYNSQLSDIETALSTCVLKDGTQTITANIPMSGFKFTGVNTNSGNTSRSEFVSAATLQDGSPLDAGLTAGSSTVYTATLSPAITAYADKQNFRVQFDEACGNSPTINFNSVGAKKIYKNVAGSAVQLVLNDVQTNFVGELRYDTALDAAAGGFWLTNFVPPQNTTLAALPGYIYGLGLTNNGSDANNDIDFAVGRAVDSTGAVMMVLGSALTKRLDASWAVGTNQGGLFTGSKAINTWYHCFVIYRSDTGVVDCGFDTSVTAANIPSGYTNYRRLGAILTDGSNNIIAFLQTGDSFYWKSPTRQVNTANPGTSAVLSTLLVPLGVKTEVIMNALVGSGTTGGAYYLYISDPDLTDIAASATTTIGSVVGNTSAGTYAQISGNQVRCMSNTSSQIRYRISQSDAGTGVSITTIGWIDPRGAY